MLVAVYYLFVVLESVC